jgi:hypothetical protein
MQPDGTSVAPELRIIREEPGRPGFYVISN